MEKGEVLEMLNAWNFWKRRIETGIQREYYSKKIASLIKDANISVVIETGIRRAGKSFIARQVANALIKGGFPKERILIVNLEDERLIERNYASLLEMYNAYKRNINPKQSSIVIIDEAQEVEGWERFVRGLSERGEAKFIVTGSSSKLLDSEYATLLSGREVIVYVHTLNLLEYLNFTGAKDGTGRYILEGGFPAIALSENKAIIASSYFDTIILKDVVQRHRIHKQDELVRLSRFYVTSVGSKTTFNSISKFLKLPIKTAYNFSHYLEESYLIFFVDRFSFSIKSQDNSPRKVYCIDNVFPAMLGINPIEIRGRLLENTIASTLYFISRHVKDFRFYYWYDNKKEVDFVISDKRKYRILQVAYSVTSDEVRTRELSAILECATRLNIDHAEIVTMDYDGDEVINGVSIFYITAQEWIKRELTNYGLR